MRPSRVLEVLGIDPGIPLVDEPGFPRARCEVWVPHGHEGKPGRLDILLELSPKLICAVEVKLISADDEDARMEKHEGYVRSLKKMYPDSTREYVLIATDGQDNHYGEFRLRPWREIALALRVQLRRLNLEHNAIQAAMIAGFVSAVEQNILALSAPELKSYLEDFMTEIV